MKKNDLIDLAIDDVTLEGSGVGRHEGMAVFVPFTAPGDVIRCRIVKVNKSYAFGIADTVISPSSARSDRGCEVYGKCGGCTFRHISYEEEARLKEKAVTDVFRRIGKFSAEDVAEPVIAASEADRYRNKAQYPVAEAGGRAVCGFYAPRSHRVIQCDDCLLEPPVFGEIARRVLSYADSHGIAPYDELGCRGTLRHIYIRQGRHTGQIMVCLVCREYADLAELAALLRAEFPDIRAVVLSVNPDNTNVILGKKFIPFYGDGTIEDIMCGLRIRLSPQSFYQVNTHQAERLYAKACEYASPEGADVLDLYCGAGTIGLSMAHLARHVTGAEIVPQAVENAIYNAKVNGISNADFICADAAKAAERFAREGRTPDVIITDPPRKGCDRLTLDSMVRMRPERIVMVSCDPSTAARDCRILADEGYRLDRLCAVDLYPGTPHVECVVQLSKGDTDNGSPGKSDAVKAGDFGMISGY
ncbi:MAG: 23S rRNA (uracil(1939)-C(5))-methyltransferase RlmD [Oscillospiraceae bacterium]|nr:23S rRNA (uracil(1939)-C(5))-methyltransferase RlmD [Oscillospiraceae bacterium]MBQ8979052.1 23S rRNA (uracil(1939)-C(5))-methyltransferase RlmD [Oscillospiraceae bacterium]